MSNSHLFRYIYVFYRGETVQFVGTDTECAEHFGMNVRSVHWHATPPQGGVPTRVSTITNYMRRKLRKSMYIRLKDLLLRQPFEKIMELATQEGIVITWHPDNNTYQCTFWIKTTQHFTSAQQKITNSVVDAILMKLVEEDRDV